MVCTLTVSFLISSLFNLLSSNDANLSEPSVPAGTPDRFFEEIEYYGCRQILVVLGKEWNIEFMHSFIQSMFI